MVGDHTTDKDAELERPNRFTLTDTRTGTPNGQAVLLGTDGALHVYDPATVTETASIPVIAAWSEPDEWQSPMPNLFIQGDRAYVSDPATKTLVCR